MKIGLCGTVNPPEESIAMTRPHEDIQHHTAVEHREGGPPIRFPANTWCAIDMLHTKTERAPAAVSAYETLIELARKSAAKAGDAAILKSVDERRVVALVEVGGHEALKHLQAAWDDHHLYNEHRASAESRALALYQVIAATGDCTFDAASKSVYAFEQFPTAPQQVEGILPGLASAPGFLGAQLFGTDDGTKSLAIYRFEHRPQIEALRSNAVIAHPVKTF
jgi:hypothetical protein